MAKKQTPSIDRRLTTEEGHQIVEINGRYAFAWVGRGLLKQGERVVAPGPSVGSQWTGIVTGFGTRFNGTLKVIIGREHDEPRPQISPAEDVAIKREYLKGMSIRDVATMMNRSYGGVYDSLLRTGTTLRKRGGWRR